MPSWMGVSIAVGPIMKPRAAIKETGTDYTAYIYEGVNHGFYNDTTPRSNEAIAKLSWKRTIDF